MGTSFRARLLVVLGSVLISACAHAGPTALFLIPISDVLKHREAFVYLGTQGNERNVDKKYYHYFAATVGVFDWLELGVDDDLEGLTTYNFKVNLFQRPKQAPKLGLSVGATGMKDRDWDPYAVASYDLKNGRLHGGVWSIGGVNRGFAGVDFPVGNSTATIEYIGGPGATTWASLFVPVAKVEGLGVLVAVGFPSKRSDGIQHSALIYYAFRL